MFIFRTLHCNLNFTFSVTLWLVRILVQNGQCVFATWITLATMLSFTIILVYVDSPGLPVATLRGKLTTVNINCVNASFVRLAGYKDLFFSIHINIHYLSFKFLIQREIEISDV